MPAEPLVSVIIPAYDVAVCLGRCLDSVFEQDVTDTQVIVINDGSTDDTAEVAKRYGDRIVYLEQENQGQGAARNAGLRIARGRYVAFLDADDYWLPGFLRACIDFLAAAPRRPSPSARARSFSHGGMRRGSTLHGWPGLPPRRRPNPSSCRISLNFGRITITSAPVQP